jgi:PAS domain S-box-containing protein
MRDLVKSLLTQSEPLNFGLLRAIINSTSDAIFVKDDELRYLLINKAGARFIGRPVRRILGKSDEELLPEDVSRQTLRHDQEVLRTGKTISYEDTEIVKGVSRTFQTTKSVYRDQDGKIIGIFGIARDITERKQIEADRERLIDELQQALLEIKTLKETLPICMHCRKIRDDKGAWTELEAYIKAHTNSEFSHGLCTECYRIYYPETFAKRNPGENK